MAQYTSPNIWGPHFWYISRCVANNYPLNPTREDKEHVKTFFNELQHILPCDKCKYTYGHHIKKNPIDPHLISKEKLIDWVEKIKLETGKAIKDNRVKVLHTHEDETNLVVLKGDPPKKDIVVKKITTPDPPKPTFKNIVANQINTIKLDQIKISQQLLEEQQRERQKEKYKLEQLKQQRFLTEQQRYEKLQLERELVLHQKEIKKREEQLKKEREEKQKQILKQKQQHQQKQIIIPIPDTTPKFQAKQPKFVNRDYTVRRRDVTDPHLRLTRRCKKCEH